MSFTVFLGNLPTWVTADDIKQWLAAEDLVADAVKVIRNHETQESKGFAFVEAPTNDEMQSIIRRFDRAPLEDRLLRANPAQPPKGKDAPSRSGAAVAAAARGTQCHPNRTTSRPQEARWTKSRAVAPQRVCYRAGEGPVSQASPARAAPAPPWSAVHTCERKSQPAFFYPSYFQSVAIGLRRAFGHSMKYSWLGCLLVGSLLFAGTQDSDLNVNKRYTVDTVIVAGKGWKTNVADQQNDRISSGLRKDLPALIGQKLNPGILDGLAARLKKEFSASEVSHHVLRGDTPDHVRVEFEVRPPHYGVDATVTKFLYDSKQGWSGAGSVGFTVQQNTFAFGLASDGDTLNERFAGISARYENKHLGSDRVGLRFQFESYHEQWNQSTLDALAAHPDQTSDAYRTRQNFQPTATISLAKPLTLEIGVGFQRFQNQFPAAHTEAANALISTLRYHRRLADSEYQQDVDAGYTLRAATKLLDSDFVYTSHLVGLHYRVAHGKHQLMEQVVAGYDQRAGAPGGSLRGGQQLLPSRLEQVRYRPDWGKPPGAQHRRVSVWALPGVLRCGRRLG